MRRYLNAWCQQCTCSDSHLTSRATIPVLSSLMKKAELPEGRSCRKEITKRKNPAPEAVGAGGEIVATS